MHQLGLRVVRSYRAPQTIHHALALPHWSRVKTTLRAFATSLSTLDKNDPESSIKFYQQPHPWSSERRPVDPDKVDLEDEDLQEAKWLKGNIDRLENELREMRGEGTERANAFIEPLLSKLPEQDRREARLLIKRFEAEEAKKAERLKDFLPKLEIKWELPPRQNTYLRTLNSSIRNVTVHMGDILQRRKLWHAYTRCKAFLPPFTHLIPDTAWAILWKTLLIGSLQEDPHWTKRLLRISSDMEEAGKQLAPNQIMLQIEALRDTGRLEEAIAKWQDLGKIVEHDRRGIVHYELVGVRLFTSQNNLDKAEEIASQYLNHGGVRDSRIFIPMLRTWIERGDEIGMKHAWVLYLRLRSQLGQDITMDDYENVYLSFLDSGQAELALAVFKDLMLTGQQTGQSSMELYQKYFEAFDKAKSSTATVREMNEVSLTGLIVLPRRLQNKYFYASWMKKLIGMGRPDSAASVIKLMYKRGANPDSRHLNGIVAAWLRTGKDTDKAKAEKIAWAMVQERINFVANRPSGSPHSQEYVYAHGPRSEPLPPDLRLPIARANIETFSMLLQYYGRRSRHDDVERLQKALATAEIPPNSYWMNHLLYIELRRGKPRDAWNTYHNMHQTTPSDLETYNCLWNCGKELLNSMRYSQDDFPSPRKLMHEMMSWYFSRGENEREYIRADFSEELYTQIIRCLSHTTDLPGIVVAMYALRDEFGRYPNDVDARVISAQVARMIHRTPGQGGAANRQRHRRNSMARANHVFQMAQKRRTEVLVECGYDDLDHLTEEIQREERLFIAVDFARSIFQGRVPKEGALEKSMAVAAAEMGVPAVRIEDPLHTRRV